MIQPGTILRIILNGQDLYFTDEHAIQISDTSQRNQISSFKGISYWMVKVLHHDPKQGSLFVDVVGGGKDNGDFGPEQSLMNHELSCVKILRVKDFPTNILIQTCHLQGYSGSLHCEPSVVTEPFIENSKVELFPTKENFKEVITVPVKYAQIGDGFVVINYTLKRNLQCVDLKIPNGFLKKEFDAIKSYFWNCLDVKKLKVHVEVELSDGKITSAIAESEEVDRINQGLIESVQYKIIRDAYNKRNSLDSEAVMITKEEFIRNISLHNQFINDFINEEVLLNGLIAASQTKHYRNVRYLTEIHQFKLSKLRLVMEPFSFIFLVESKNNYHIVWETLNGTDATYVWSYPKEMSQITQYYKDTDRILKRISQEKRYEYLKAPDPNFQRIIHDYSDKKEGYLKWMKSINHVLNV